VVGVGVGVLLVGVLVGVGADAVGEIGVRVAEGAGAVGSATLGDPSERVGVGTPEPLPTEPQPARAPTATSDAATTTIRMAHSSVSAQAGPALSTNLRSAQGGFAVRQHVGVANYRCG
jgi:hypothetical protein